MRLDGPHMFNDLVFLLGNNPNTLPFIKNVFNLRGGAFHLDVSDCANGKYLLADGADNFNGTIELRNTASTASSPGPDSPSITSLRGESLAEISVGQTIRIDGFSYSLHLDSGTLSLTVDSAKK